MVVKYNRRSTSICPLRELRHALLGGHFGDTIELEGTEPSMDSLLHLSRHPNGIHEEEQFWLEQHRNWVRRYDTTRHSWSMQLREWWHPGESEWDQKLGKIECVFSLYDKMRWKWDDVYLLHITPSSSVTRVFPYTRQGSLKMYLDAVIERVWRCTWRPWLSEFGDAHGGCDWSRSEEY